MKTIQRLWFGLAAAALLALVIAGCNSSTHSKLPDEVTVSDPQTGDLTQFPNSSLLASARDLLDDDTLVLIDARPSDAYAEGHIPGAINLVWNDFSLWNDPPERPCSARWPSWRPCWVKRA